MACCRIVSRDVSRGFMRRVVLLHATRRIFDCDASLFFARQLVPNNVSLNACSVRFLSSAFTRNEMLWFEPP